MLDANEKICVRFFKNMRYEIVAFKTSIGYYQRFLRECVAFQHFNQRADFIFLWLRLNDDIGKGTVENVIKRRDMKLIYAVWNTVILDEGGSGRIARQIDRCSVNCQQAIALKEIVVGASGIEVGENCAEHFGRDLSAALRDRRRGSLNARVVQNLS